jgi:integrase
MPHAAQRALTPKVPSYEPRRAPESDVIRAAIAAANGVGPHLGAFLRLAAVTGARREELCALRWNDFDASALTVRIDEAVKKTGGGTLVLGPTKTHAQRWISVDEITFTLVTALRNGTTSDDAFVFGTEDGASPIAPDAWTNRWRRVREKVPGAEHVRLHDFRHWQGTQGAQVAPLPVVQARLGHSRLSTTGIYAKGRSAADVAAAAALAAELAD